MSQLVLRDFAPSLPSSFPFPPCTPRLSDAGSYRCWAHTEICHCSVQLQGGAAWAGPEKAPLGAFPRPCLTSWLKSILSFLLPCHLPLLTSLPAPTGTGLLLISSQLQSPFPFLKVDASYLPAQAELGELFSEGQPRLPKWESSGQRYKTVERGGYPSRKSWYPGQKIYPMKALPFFVFCFVGFF